VDLFHDHHLQALGTFVLFTYDYNQKSWAFLKKTKNATFETFNVFKNIIEKGKKIQILKINCGGEFVIG
jgi:hypothetical protein